MGQFKSIVTGFGKYKGVAPRLGFKQKAPAAAVGSNGFKKRVVSGDKYFNPPYKFSCIGILADDDDFGGIVNYLLRKNRNETELTGNKQK